MNVPLDLWAIIPVKPFQTGKSRLASVLGASERAALNRWLFDHVFAIALGGFEPDRIAVVTADAELLALVRERGAHGVPERTDGDLNAALGLAIRYVNARGAGAVLILPSDLPYLAGADVAALKSAIGPAPCCVIAADTSEQGTNALVIAPPDPALLRFGPLSFSAHLRLNRVRGIPARILRRPGLAHDLDTPDDYEMFENRRPDLRLARQGSSERSSKSIKTIGSGA
jgi:2-phospho-L-lactate guanylyltransferase